MPKIKLDMPLDVRIRVLKYQADLKIKKGIGSYSQQATLYAIVREHEEFCKQAELSKKIMAFNK